MPPLAPVQLRAELTGRLRNLTKLKHWCMAVAEAIKNAMDSLTDAGHSNGKIEIELVRNPDLIPQGPHPIERVIIRDNGVGFTEPNFQSFCTPDSIYKLARGGKGVGRLTCLQAFQRVEVASDFQNSNGWEHRDVHFNCEAPVMTASLGPSANSEPRTEVSLVGLREDYHSAAAMSCDDFCDWLIEHFLPSLVEKPAWLNSIVVRDGDRGVDLTSVASGAAIWSTTFSLGKYEFRVACYPMSSEVETAKRDQVRLVAVGRVVHANTREIEHYLPHLRSIDDEKSHVVLIYSPYFDEHVNDARNGVPLGDESNEMPLFGFSSAQFAQQVATAIKAKVSDRLDQCEGALREKVESIVRKEAPSYRFILDGFFESEEFAEMPLSSTQEGILTSLDTYKRRETARLKKESKRLSKLAAETEGYAEAAQKLAEKIEQQKKFALAEYVSLRKIVLDRLESLLTVDENGAAARESAIHNLIFPQRTDTENHPFIGHQLWILDERLESNAYLASDQPVDRKTGDRPDLLVALDRPGAFASDPSPKAKGYERIALVEFKRALLDLATCSTDDLPHRQMMRYARQIEAGKVEHAGSGRQIKTAADVRYYMYAVCELSPALLERLVREEQ